MSYVRLGMLCNTCEDSRMASIEALQERYVTLDQHYAATPQGVIDPGCLLAFDYEYPGQDTEVTIDTDEFTAVCPWTGLPDVGTVHICYVPDHLCIELKSLKYYLLSYRNVGIVQEHAANRLLQDLVAVCQPRRMRLTLDYNVRGGLHTTVTAHYQA